MKFGGKKLFLFGFLTLLLVGIPLTVYYLQQQQETRSRAEKATNLTFTPDSSATSPIKKSVGDDIALDVMVNPGTNLVSFVKLEIQYDPDKIATASSNAFQPNSVAFPSVLEGPVYTNGKIAVTLSVGPDPTKAIQTLTKAATFTFQATNPTDTGTPTLVTYSASTQVLSIGSTDQASENVLANAQPATIEIAGDATSPTPTTPSSTTPTETPTIPPTTSTPSPTVGLGTPTPTTIVTTGTANESPVCSSLNLDRTPSGTAPFAMTFTAVGDDIDGTISKVTFNFGDGQVSDVTTGGGIGTDTVDAQLSHTYNTAGTFEASALLTDNSGGISDTTSCKQTITVTGGTGGGTETVATATPTIAATGITEVFLGFGAVALFLVVGGALLFFMI